MSLHNSAHADADLTTDPTCERLTSDKKRSSKKYMSWNDFRAAYLSTDQTDTFCSFFGKKNMNVGYNAATRNINGHQEFFVLITVRETGFQKPTQTDLIRFEAAELDALRSTLAVSEHPNASRALSLVNRALKDLDNAKAYMSSRNDCVTCSPTG